MIDVGSPGAADPAVIVLSGELSLGANGPAHASLTAALRDHLHVVATVEPGATIDLSGVQLIESARRTALDAGGSFVLAEPATGDFHETLRRGGFLQTPEQRGFWLNAPGEQ